MKNETSCKDCHDQFISNRVHATQHKAASGAAVSISKATDGSDMRSSACHLNGWLHNSIGAFIINNNCECILQGQADLLGLCTTQSSHPKTRKFLVNGALTWFTLPPKDREDRGRMSAPASNQQTSEKRASCPGTRISSAFRRSQ